jgi:hypothetical protein
MYIDEQISLSSWFRVWQANMPHLEAISAPIQTPVSQEARRVV